MNRRAKLLSGGATVLKRVRRSCADDPIEGYVIDISDTWVLMALLSDYIALEGFVIFRLKDVRKVKVRDDKSAFVQKSLEIEGCWPPPAPPISIDIQNIRTMFDGITRVVPVLGIHIERIDPDNFFVGVPAGFTESGIRIKQIDYTAKWDLEPDPEVFDFDDISMIVFGGTYIRRVYAVASLTPANNSDETQEPGEW